VRCDSDLIQNSPSFIPTDTSSYQTIRAYSTALHASCLRDTGPLVDHVDEISVAKDIDALRVALGEDKLSLYGISHVTLTGEMYAENFSTHVRALLLDSVKDDSLSTSASQAAGSWTDEDSLNQFAAWCDHTTSCAVHSPGVDTTIDTLYQREQAGTLYQPGDPSHKIDPLTLVRRSVVNGFYGPQWINLEAELRGFLDERPTGVAPQLAAAQPDPTVPYPTALLCDDSHSDISSPRQLLDEWHGSRCGVLDPWKGCPRPGTTLRCRVVDPRQTAGIRSPNAPGMSQAYRVLPVPRCRNRTVHSRRRRG
jgi:pimeloyl-ACP methyl ester carboxylesterase